MAKELKWSAPEFEYHEKGVGWYWTVVILGIILITLSLIQGNFLFSVFVVVAGVLVMLWGKQLPHQINFKITSSGVDAGGKKFYAYDHLTGFASRRLDEHEAGYSELILRQKHRLSTYIKFLAPNKILDEARHLLNQYLPEVEYDDSLVDHVSRWLRF